MTQDFIEELHERINSMTHGLTLDFEPKESENQEAWKEWVNMICDFMDKLCEFDEKWGIQKAKTKEILKGFDEIEKLLKEDL